MTGPLRQDAEGSRPTIALVAGDVSGDHNGAHLAAALRRAVGDVRLVGAGGEAMRRAGVELLSETTALSFVGVLEAIPRIGQLVGRYRALRREIADVRPDLVVLIDGEAVTVPFARWLRRRGIPAVFYFPPQVWFWGRWRLRRVAPLARKFLSAFREEAELFSRAGADGVWVGHPLRDRVRPGPDPRATLAAGGWDPDRPLVVVMPGSRRGEIARHAAPFLGAAARVQQRDSRLQFAIPLASEAFRRPLEDVIRSVGLRDVRLHRPDGYDVLSCARAVLQSSGTATLESGLLGIPSVIAYRCIPLEYHVGRRLIRSSYIGMVNILLEEEVQPEFFHRNVDAETLGEALWSLLTDEVRRGRIESRLASLPDRLGPRGALDRAAVEIADVVRELEPEDVTAEEGLAARGL